VVRALGDVQDATRTQLSSATGLGRGRIGQAIETLLSDGLIEHAGGDRFRLHRGTGLTYL
jgi:DNA-binding IclR family transcriptional regulator